MANKKIKPILLFVPSFNSVDVGGEEKNKKNETVRDADIDEQEPETEKERGKGHESSDDEAVVFILMALF